MQNTRSRADGSLLVSCVVGVGTAVLLSLVTGVGIALLVSAEKLNIGSIPFATILIQFLSAMIGSLLAGRIMTGNRQLACVLTAGVYFLLLLGCALLFWDGITSGILVGTIACGLGCLMAVILCRKRNTRNTRTRKRWNYR